MEGHHGQSLAYKKQGQEDLCAWEPPEADTENRLVGKERVARTERVTLTFIHLRV